MILCSPLCGNCHLQAHVAAALCFCTLKCVGLQVSLSLGCPAVFVFGGESREEDALALLLRSGDVLVMVYGRL